MNTLMRYFTVCLLCVFVLSAAGVSAGEEMLKNNRVGSSAVQKKVKFYMTSWCPYCRKMEQLLVSSHIPFDKFDIEKDSKAQKEFHKMGGRGIPFLVVGNTVVPGYDPDAVLAAWEQYNK